MKISNETNWKTADLRAILYRIAAVELSAAQRKTLRVEIAPARNQRHSETADYWSDSRTFTSGYAWWGGRGRIRICMPTRFALNGRERVGLCATIAHEMAHIRTRMGGRSVETAMRTSIPYGCDWRLSDSAAAAQRELYAWVHDMPISRKTARRASVDPAALVPVGGPDAATRPPTLIQRRAEKAAATLARWERELSDRERAVKRARRKLAEARRRVAYYAKKTAAD